MRFYAHPLLNLCYHFKMSSTHPFPPLHARLIFNPISWAADESPVQLLALLTELQDWNILPEVYLIQQDSDVVGNVQEALAHGIRFFIVCGGDGTIDTVAGQLAGTNSTLGIIPTGTQNNVALSLGVPGHIPTAVSILRSGKPIQVDMGQITCQGKQVRFLEACSVGLLSALFPAADDIQHGNLVRVGDLLAALVASPSAEMHISIDEHTVIDTQGHIVLIGNMPYIGPHYAISSEDCYYDGFLDVILYAQLSKLELLGNVVNLVGGGPQDPRIKHFRAQHINIVTTPPMPVMADGFDLGQGEVQIDLLPQALTIMSATDEMQSSASDEN